jgi:hypothetical protein
MRGLGLLILTAVVFGGCGPNAEDVQPPFIPDEPASVPRVAEPQQDTAMVEARAAMRRGNRLYNDQNYAEARAEFVAAKQLGLHSADTWIAACDQRGVVGAKSAVTSLPPMRPTPRICSICRGRGNLLCVEGGFARAQQRYRGPYTGYYDMATCPQCRGAGYVFPESWSDTQCGNWMIENARRKIAEAQRRLR